MEVVPVPSQEKKEKVAQIQQWFDSTDSLFVMRYRGLKVSESAELRQKVKELGGELRVLKNTLTRIALAETPKEGLSEYIDGPAAVVFVKEDPAPVAKLLKDFSKGRKEFFFNGGIIDGRIYGATDIDAFATLPPRDEMLARAIGQASAPLYSLVNVMVGPIRKMLGVLQAVAEKKPAVAESAPAVEKAEEAPVAESAPAPESDTVDAVKAEEKVEEAPEAEKTEEPQAAEEAAAQEPGAEAKAADQAETVSEPEAPASEAKEEAPAAEAEDAPAEEKDEPEAE